MKFTSAGTEDAEETFIFDVKTETVYMEELRELFQQTLNQNLIQMVLSNTTDETRATKVKIRPVLIKGVLQYQETLYRGKQVFHSNHTAEEMQERLLEYMRGCFRQAQICNHEREATVLVSKKGKAAIRERKNNKKESQIQKVEALNHNRTKQYLLQEGEPADFLVELGVQTPDGRVVKAKYDKFRQINRYLEFIRDILDKLPSDRTVRIVDFGCGKSYLTFAMYYYLRQIKGLDIQVTGLDLKADVIARCNALAEKLQYGRLHFQAGDISHFQGGDGVDMVVSLHACDKATDYALEKAVKWGARVILAVPCCQHELNGQIRCDMLGPVLKYGLIKERMAALITDALRANLLEKSGYDTQILEFIDMEHTPKNLMIRAVKHSGMRPSAAVWNVQKDRSLDQLMEFLQVSPALKELL